MTEIHPRYTIMAVRAVAVLALPAERQVGWLRSLGLGEPGLTDEIAQEIEDAALLMPQMVEHGWFGSEAAEIIGKIDGILRERSEGGDEGFWRVEALSRESAWERLRDLACQFLATI